MSKKTFLGGVHPDAKKELSKDVPFHRCVPGNEVIFPLGQHIGKPASPVVQKGDLVLAGQIIAEADGFVSANIVSSCSGKVKAIEKRENAIGVKLPCIVIENDGAFTRMDGIGEKCDYTKLSAKEIVDKVKAAGIVGLGGAGFPTHVKLSPKNPDGIEYMIANGAECEPYITCDDQLMRIHAEEIVTGMEVLLSLFPKAKGLVVIEENKPEAIEAMTRACSGKTNIKVFPVKTKYPQGGEYSIISAVTGRYLKRGVLPADAGCIVDNVSTIFAVYNAVCNGEPLMERGFTVTGDGVKEPGNFIVKIGTPFKDVVAAAGGLREDAKIKKVLSGGPMMGFAIADLEGAIQKNSSAIVALTDDEVEDAQEQMTACLRCGRCNTVCPLGLTPQMMAVAATRKDYEKFEKKLYGMECVSCGSCTYVCPAKRPLMQLFKYARAEVIAAGRK